MDELIKEAKSIIKLLYQKDKHTVGAALRTKSGKIFTGISINGLKMDLCAEWSALAKALEDGESLIESIVAVHQKKDGTFEIYPPCALCRELLITYCPNSSVILSETKSIVASDLLPSAWAKNQ